MGRNLGADSLHGWLEKEEGWQVRRLSARSGYRLLRVTALDEFERTGVTPDGRWTRPGSAGGTSRRAATAASANNVKRLNREWRRRTEGRLALLLDSVGQPFNVGSIIRTAAAFGVESVWLCGNTPDLDPARRRQDRARHRAVPVRLPDAVAGRRGQGGGRGRVPGHRGGTRLGRGPDLRRALDGPICLAIGNEDHGCSPATLSAVHGVAYIPQVGRVGSLNVAVAAAVALSEARRREWSATED